MHRQLPFLVGMTGLLLGGCGNETGDLDSSRGDPRYVFATGVSTPDGSSTLIELLQDLPSGNLSLEQAFEVPGGAGVEVFGNKVYILELPRLTLTRYGVSSGRLQREESINFSDRGGAVYMFFLSETRAFTLNRSRLELVEWNPTAMTITGSIDISMLRRNDIGEEIRSGFLRRSDATLFLYLTYTTMRQIFRNEFTMLVVDLDTGNVSIEVEPQCPASAGFGGFIDDGGNLYVSADSFGGFTFLLDPSQVKANCVLRFPAGSRTLDPGYLFRPQSVLNGNQPWGLYRAAGTQAYSTGVDTSRLAEFGSPIEFLGSQIHEGWLIDVQSQTAMKIDTLPTDGIGLGGYNVGNRLLVPRSSGTVRVNEIENAQTAFYFLDPSTNEAQLQFTAPGVINNFLSF